MDPCGTPYSILASVDLHPFTMVNDLSRGEDNFVVVKLSNVKVVIVVHYNTTPDVASAWSICGWMHSLGCWYRNHVYWLVLIIYIFLCVTWFRLLSECKYSRVREKSFIIFQKMVSLKLAYYKWYSSPYSFCKGFFYYRGDLNWSQKCCSYYFSRSRN